MTNEYNFERKQQPTITIIIPLFNKVKEIERALRSILNQTVNKYELLIIDGGSTDGSLEKIYPYLADSRFHLIHQKGRGLPGARNEGIMIASGDIITFLDADDEWYPDFLETIINLYNKYPEAGLYGTSYERYALTSAKPSPLKFFSEKTFEGYLPSYFQVYVKSGYPPFCPCCVALNKTIFSKVGYFNEKLRISEDVEMWVRIAYYLPIVFTSKIHARYHLYSENKMSLDYYPIKILPPLEFLLSIPKDELKKRDDYQYILETIDYLWLITAYYNIGAGCKKNAKYAIKNAHLNTHKLKKMGLLLLILIPSIISKKLIIIYANYPMLKDCINYRLTNFLRRN